MAPRDFLHLSFPPPFVGHSLAWRDLRTPVDIDLSQCEASTSSGPYQDLGQPNAGTTQ